MEQEITLALEEINNKCHDLYNESIDAIWPEHHQLQGQQLLDQCYDVIDKLARVEATIKMFLPQQ